MIIHNDQIVCFDVDDTLILWDHPEPDFSIQGIPVKIHTAHVASLKRFKARGQYVIVWSAGGSAWASRVVKELELEPYVDLVMCKPRWTFDDRPLSELAELCYYKEGNYDARKD